MVDKHSGYANCLRGCKFRGSAASFSEQGAVGDPSSMEMRERFVLFALATSLLALSVHDSRL